MLKPGALMWHQHHVQNTSRDKLSQHHLYRIFWKTIAELSGSCFVSLAKCIRR